MSIPIFYNSLDRIIWYTDIVRFNVLYIKLIFLFSLSVYRLAHFPSLLYPFYRESYFLFLSKLVLFVHCSS